MTAETLTVLFLFGTVALRVGLVALVMWVLVPRRRHCAACGRETAALVSPRALSLLRLERRWCLACGWWGFSKRVPLSVPAPRRPVPQSVAPGA